MEHDCISRNILSFIAGSLLTLVVVAAFYLGEEYGDTVSSLVQSIQTIVGDL